ncbi:uncharacterized protein LOC144425764 [Styela clava]
MYLLARVLLLIVSATFCQSIVLSQFNLDLCSKPEQGSSVRRTGDIHTIWELKADSCISVNTALLVNITENKLYQNSQCIGSLKITGNQTGLVDTELCDSKLNDCFLFASKAVSDKSITDGCNGIYQHNIEDNVFPISLTYKTGDGYSHELQEFKILLIHRILNNTELQQTTERNSVPTTSNYHKTYSENEPTATQSGYLINNTQSDITSIPITATMRDSNGYDGNCNTKDKSILIIVPAVLLGLAVLLIITLTLRFYHKLANYRQLLSTTSKMSLDSEPRQEKEAQQENEVQQENELQQENDEAQESNNSENIEDMYSVVNKNEKTSKKR